MATKRKRLARPVVEADEPLRKWALNLGDNLLLCRDLGHTWRPSSARYLPELKAYERVLRCGRCRTDRIQMLDGSGRVLSNHYDYSEGYMKPRGSGKITREFRDELRLESLMRLIGEDSVK